MKWASLGKWLGILVAIIPQIIQLIGTIKNGGTPPMPPDVINGVSLLGGGLFGAGLGKESADNLNRTKLIVATEPNAIPVEKQDAAVKKMEEQAKT